MMHGPTNIKCLTAKKQNNTRNI